MRRTLNELVIGLMLFTGVVAKSNAQTRQNLNDMGKDLKNSYGYTVHGTAMSDTVYLDLFDPNNGQPLRLVPEIYISQADSGNNRLINKSFSITFSNLDTLKKYSSIISAFNGYADPYNASKSPQDNAVSLNGILTGLTGVKEQKNEDNSAQSGIYPNPFNNNTIIQYSAKESEHVKMDVFDVAGRLINTVFDGQLNQGVHKFSWNTDVSSGIYFLCVKRGGTLDVYKMVKVK